MQNYNMMDIKMSKRIKNQVT